MTKPLTFVNYRLSTLGTDSNYSDLEDVAARMPSYINMSFIISVLCQSDEVHIQNITRARPEVFTSGLVRVPFWKPVNVRT
jgi:hypothetical protein